MTQISLFAVGYAVMTLGALVSLARGGKDCSAPHLSGVAGLAITVVGVAAVVAGAAAG